MKVTPRITIATGMIVAVAVGTWSYFDLRSAQKTRQESLEHEGRTVALGLRATLEGQAELVDPVEASRLLSQSIAPWRVVVATFEHDTELTEAGRRRLASFEEAPTLTFSAYEDGAYLVALPLRAAPERAQDPPKVLGMV